MRWPSGIDLMPEATHTLMGPDERALAWELVGSFAQGTAFGGRRGPDIGFSTDPFVGGITVNSDWLGGVLTGVAGGGAHGSLGEAFAAALQTGQHLLVTSERLALVDDGRLTLAVPLGAVASVEPAPRLLQRGRLRLEFADGSWATVLLGMVSRRASRRVLDALGTGR